MLHSAVCSVHIESAPPNGYFTDGDTVTGYVQLEVRRELYVASVEAHLCCEDRGRTYLRDSEDVVDMHSHFDHYETIWSTDTVSFDLPQADGQLPKGQYRFQFEFKLPKDAQNLPSSYNVESAYDFNGIFWGVHATIDRDTRVRSNYNAFGEIRMLPQRHRIAPLENREFKAATHEIKLRLHSRPSFLLSDTTKNILSVEGRLEASANGLMQTREGTVKDEYANNQIRVAVRSNDDEQIVVSEVVLFLDTTTSTLVHENQGVAQAAAIVIEKPCEETTSRAREWCDLSHLVTDARIYGLPETWTTNLHDIKHQLRVQITVAPQSRPTRTSILEVKLPVVLHSEMTVTSNRSESPPPPYKPDSQTLPSEHTTNNANGSLANRRNTIET